MPKIPKRPCRYPGCLNLCERGIYCEEHSDYSSDRLRGGAAARGYDAHWRKARKAFLLRRPLCVECLKSGVLTPATVGKEALPAASSPVCELPVAGRPHAGHGRGPHRPAPW